MRTYHFPLPYELGIWKTKYAIKYLKRKGVWPLLPNDLRNKIINSKNQRKPLLVTKDDLDSLNDKTWDIIAQKLELKWD